VHRSVNIGAAIIAAIPDFIVVLAFRSFWLSGRSGFPVVLAFRSFWLSGRSNFPVVMTFLWSQHKFKKDKRGEQFVPYCLCATKLPINFAVASGNGNKIFSRKPLVRKEY
jgi:hypothetical protein